MSIAIMSCRKLVGKCAGTGCLNAFNNDLDAFTIYKNKKETLASFFYCSGCSSTLGNDEDWQHKINQLKNKNVDTIHIALCIEVECDNYSKHEKILKANGFKVIHGTHK
ncbi:CGGC domain-containing protein [Clostridium senegalense]|uniref:CGGC domain-containing protein n=1 Tax=Clostridium senegalense TaxID=1465809 RepID=UPI001C117395|nr:CGGC domain-containing protein [Clostridium senegalense]MBU5227180.1 CGGC domain-containing protein [Clostridium senegalense]